jgi:hypothetical protein
VGTLRAEDLFPWSRRVLDAERAVAENKADELRSLADHWKRMRQLRRKVEALFIAGAKGGEAETYAAARYYAAEAELWLLAAGGELPEDEDPVAPVAPPDERR